MARERYENRNARSSLPVLWPRKAGWTEALGLARELSQNAEHWRYLCENAIRNALQTQSAPGNDTEFFQFLPYQSGDPTTRIDWRATARHGIPVQRQELSTRAPHLYLYITPESSFRYRSAKSLPEKHFYAAVLGLFWAELARQYQGEVKLIGQDYHHSMPELAQNLLTPLLPETDFLPPITEQAGLCLWWSDFWHDPALLTSTLAGMQQRAIQPILLWLCDPVERDWQWQGHIRFQALDRNQSWESFAAQALQTPYQKALEQHEQELQKTCQKFGGHLLLQTTKDHPQTALQNMAALIDQITLTAKTPMQAPLQSNPG